MSDEADFVTIVSSELIAEVMEDYFNKKLYKQRVRIVELKPTEAGYSFFLQFVPSDRVTITGTDFVSPNGITVNGVEATVQSTAQDAKQRLLRSSNGRFVKQDAST